MTQNNWQQIINGMQKLFLNYQDESIENLIQNLKTLEKNIKEKGMSMPYIGKLNDNYSFLRDFEQIPELPQDNDFVLKSFSNILSGALKWHHPNVMHNVIPPPMIATIAASTITSLYNLNPIWDFISAGTQEMERQTVRQLSMEIGWENAAGISTFGGKGCIIYALRIGLNRCIKKVSSCGLSNQKKPPIIITSKENHYCIDTAASLIGVGYENVWRTEVNDDETMNIASFELLLKKAYHEGHPIAAIVVCGGSSLHLTMDDLKTVSAIVDRITSEFNASYKPYIYFDSCIGWPWIFFIDYDFKANKLNIPLDVLDIIKKATDNITPITLADGLGVDFHKTGFCPYNTSMFITKNSEELNSIFKDKLSPLEIKVRGGNFLHHFTLEHSRSANAIVCAWVAMQTIGKNGFRSYLVNQIAVACELRAILTKYDMELLNPFSLTFASVFFPRPSKSNISSYWDLINQDPQTIQKYNEYTFRLFNYFQEKSRNKIDSFIFRFVPQYRKAKCKVNMAVLVIFPMSLILTPESVKEVAHKIGQIKTNFDNEKDSSNVKELMPEHVIK